MRRLDGKPDSAESYRDDEYIGDREMVRVFCDVDLPGMLRETGLNKFEISKKTGLSHGSVYKIMRMGWGENGEWAARLRFKSVSKLMALCGWRLRILAEPLGVDGPIEPLYLVHQKWFTLTPEYGPVTITATRAHLNATGGGEKWVGIRQEFPTVASAYYAQKYLPEYWKMAGRNKDLGRLLLRLRQDRKEWMVRQFAPGYALKTAYAAAFKETPEIVGILKETGERELIWECPGKRHERFHELGACPKCGVQGNLVGQILMELREELNALG